MQMNGMGWKVEEHAVAEAAVTNEFIHGCNSKGLPPPSIGWRIGSPLCRSTEMHSRVTRGQVTVGVPSCDPTKHPIVNENTQSIPITTDHRPTTTRLLQRRWARKSLRSRFRATEKEEWDSSSIIGISWMRCCRDLSTIKICSASRPSFHLNPLTARQHHSVTHSRIMRRRRRQLCWQRHVREGEKEVDRWCTRADNIASRRRIIREDLVGTNRWRKPQSHFEELKIPRRFVGLGSP